MSKERKPKKRGSRRTTVLLVFLFIIGFLIMAYPAISNFWNQMRSETVVVSYQDDIAGLPDDRLDEQLEAARAYNAAHEYNTVMDIFGDSQSEESEQYNALLNPSGNGVMGYIEIPKINQRIVIYHGTGEKELDKGAGHIAGTSLPVGGDSSHAVIAAHRGLPRAKLFTDIDRLEEGDEFYLFILNETLAYEVDQIKVIEPEDLEELAITEGEDYVTLFTCTPYGVNTHRLLVRGHRIPYVPANNDTKPAAQTCAEYGSLILVSALALLTILLIILIRRKSRRNKMRKNNARQA